jgi:serine/threonine protein kinase
MGGPDGSAGGGRGREPSPGTQERVSSTETALRMRHEALLGRKVAGRFTIRGYLGEGGMATVYVAEQDAEPRRVALKIMNEELTADRTFMLRFQREAQAASRVQHPNSVQILDYGVEGGLSYIAMELLVGDDLYVLLERQGAIAQARAARILIEVCEVLGVAHDLGIVHRDLKPENIMVIADPSHPNRERVKVLDFGIAKLLVSEPLPEDQDADIEPESSDPPSAVTRAGTFIGTPAYMSPEQCGLLPVDTRADIYTCGVLLFQLITGRLPFEGQTPLHTATLHIHEEPPPPSSYAPGIDPRLEALILKALAKNPTARPQTARHLSVALKKLLPELPDAPVATGPVSLRPQASWKSVTTGRSSAPPRGLSAQSTPPPGRSAPPHAAAAPSEDAETLPSLLQRDTPAPETPTRVRQLALARKADAAAPPAHSNARPPAHEPSEDSSRTLIRQSIPEPQPNLTDETTQPYKVPKAVAAEPLREALPTMQSQRHETPAIETEPIESLSGSIDVIIDMDLREALRHELSEAPQDDDVSAPPPPLPAPRVDTPAALSISAGASASLGSSGRFSPVPAAPTFGLSGHPPPAPGSGPGLTSSAVRTRSSAPPSAPVTVAMSAPERLTLVASLASPRLFMAFFGTTLLSSLLLVAYYFLLLRRH